jgi:hypothetical protein
MLQVSSSTNGFFNAIQTVVTRLVKSLLSVVCGLFQRARRVLESKMSSVVWTDSDPLGGDAADTIDNAAQQFRRDIRERLMQGGHLFDTETPPAAGVTANNDGKHCVGWETQTDQDDFGYFTLVWDFAGTAERIRHYGASAGGGKADLTEFIGDIGPLSPTTSIVFRGTARGVWLRALVGDAAPVIGFMKRVIYKNPDVSGTPDRSITKARLVAGSRPVGSNLIINLYTRTTAQQAVLSNDPYDSANCTIFSDPLVTLVAGSDYAVEKTFSPAETVAPGEEVVAEYTSVGSTTPATDVSLSLQVE